MMVDFFFPSFSLEELTEASKALSDVLEFDLPKLQKEITKSEEPAAKQVCDRCGRNLYDTSDNDN